MHVGEESNIGIVLTRPPNKAGWDTGGEGGGGRPVTKENTMVPNTCLTRAGKACPRGSVVYAGGVVTTPSDVMTRRVDPR
jgi:hypothetical protein